MTLRNRLLSVAIIIGALACIVPSARAATFYFHPQQQDLTVGQRFIVELRLDSEKETINAVQTALTYDRELIRAVRIVEDSSFLTLWPEPAVIDAAAGRITLTGGIPGGSLVDEGRIIGVEFEVLKSGTAWIATDDSYSRVLLHDGAGTPVTVRTIPATYSISAVSPFLLPVISSTHPDETKWYQATTVTLSWQPRADAAYSYILTTNASEIPDELPEVSSNQITYSDVSDGVYTFVLMEKLTGDEWQVVARRAVLIDRTAPQAFNPLYSAEAIPDARSVVWSTTDTTSGLAYYDIIINGTTMSSVLSPYRLPNLPANSTIVVRAYDRAGNVTEGVLSIADGIGEANRQTTLFLLSAAAILVVAGAATIIRRRVAQRH